MKGLIHKVYCDMYNTDLTVCFCDETYFKKIDKVELTGKLGGSVFDNTNSIDIFIKKCDGMVNCAVVAHEATHAAFYIADRVGLDIDRAGNNEHFAYLVEWLVDKILDCLGYENKAEGIL